MKVFHGKDRLQEFVTIKSALQRILGRIFQSKDKSKHTQDVREQTNNYLFVVISNCPTVCHVTHSGLKFMSTLLLFQCIRVVELQLWNFSPSVNGPSEELSF